MVRIHVFFKFKLYEIKQISLILVQTFPFKDLGFTKSKKGYGRRFNTKCFN
jgi:hypothetical protein